MATETHYKAAIVGCGSIGSRHIEGYQLCDDIEISAVVDPLEIARRDYQEAYNIPRGYGTIEELLSTEKPDLISICTWHPLHAPQTVAAARAGVKGILCEKPMCVDLREADRMIEACEHSGTRLVVSHQRRFTPGWEKAWELVSAGAIGVPLRVGINVLEGLHNRGTHTIDGALFVLNDPPVRWVMGAVERRTDRWERDIPIEDCCMGLVHCENDTQIFIQSDTYNEAAVVASGFDIRGADGMLWVREDQVRLFNGESNGWQDIPLRMKREEIRAIGGHANGDQARELVAWIEGRQEGHRNAGRTARATVEVMMALFESARQHQVVHFPLQEKAYPLALMIDEGKLPVEIGGRNDIRGFLRRDRIDNDAYRRLRDEGKSHFQAMLELSQESE